jgi:hypothetical protein
MHAQVVGLSVMKGVSLLPSAKNQQYVVLDVWRWGAGVSVRPSEETRK